MSKRRGNNPFCDMDYDTEAPAREITPDGVPVFCAHDAIVAVADVKPNPGNPNQHGEDQIIRLGSVIEANGWRAPVTISNRSGLVVRGHGRLMAAKHKGWGYVPVEYQDYASEEEETADLIADNRLAELSELDTGKLLDLVGELDTGDIPMELTGFTDEEIREMMEALEGTGDTEDDRLDDVPVPNEVAPMSRTGDLWQLGPHRLFVGDCTKRENVERLMAGEKAQMVNTDPPYGVSYESQSGKFDMIEGDDLTGDDLMGTLLRPAFRNCVEFTKPDAAFYIWHASSTRRDFEDAMTAAGIMEKQYIIWVKPSPVLGHADYQWAHEPCFYAEKAGQSAQFYGDRSQRTTWKTVLRGADGTATVLTGGIVLTDGEGGKVYLTDKPPKGKKIRYVRLKSGRSICLYPEDKASTVWEVSRETDTEHPTQKPVELAARAISNSSEAEDIVADFFAGSGFTLIGAETTGRRACCMELDPKYADVIVERYIRLTGNDAVTCLRDGAELAYCDLKDE